MVGALSHQPEGYVCPFCRIMSGGEAPGSLTGQADIVLQTEVVTAFIAAAWNSRLRCVVVGALGDCPARIRFDDRLSVHDQAVVLSWARRELASGKRVSWLLANDLSRLA